MDISAQECARQVLDVVPFVMRTIRSNMRSHRAPGLSVPQFRTLAYINRHERTSPSAVAEHIGLTLPSVTKLLDGLVARDLVTREADARDRRRVALVITPAGAVALQAVHTATQSYLASLLSALSPQERDTVCQAMEILHRAFAVQQRETTR